MTPRNPPKGTKSEEEGVFQHETIGKSLLVHIYGPIDEGNSDKFADEILQVVQDFRKKVQQGVVIFDLMALVHLPSSGLYPFRYLSSEKGLDFRVAVENGSSVHLVMRLLFEAKGSPKLCLSMKDALGAEG